ncbi:MAG: hypothetical protein HYY93_07925 [Planctomycetes bacterium]|nr:hypothetical protein [Planctomycetota bacterium]
MIIFCIARFVLFANSTENAIFWVTSGYMITVWVGVAAAHLTENQKFLSYLRSEHPLHGESCGFAPANGFRLLPFVWSEDDLGDIEVTRLKLQYRRVLLLGLAVFLHMPVIFLVSMIAASMK